MVGDAEFGAARTEIAAFAPTEAFMAEQGVLNFALFLMPEIASAGSGCATGCRNPVPPAVAAGRGTGGPHPMGTTRMADDPREDVVDRDLPGARAGAAGCGSATISGLPWPRQHNPADLTDPVAGHAGPSAERRSAGSLTFYLETRSHLSERGKY